MPVEAVTEFSVIGIGDAIKLYRRLIADGWHALMTSTETIDGFALQTNAPAIAVDVCATVENVPYEW